MGLQRYSQTSPNYVVKSICSSVYSALWMMSLGAASAVCFAQSATSQENIASNEPVALPSLDLEIQSIRGLSVPITPATMEQSYGSTKGGANVITPSSTGSQATLREVMGTQPGITMLDFFGGNDHPVISIRGSGIQSQPLARGITVLVDGLPLNDADGSFYTGLLEPRNSSKIGVRRGANALNPFAQNLGGEIDFLSHTGATERGSLNTQYGSHNTVANRLAIGRAFDRWDFHVAYSDQRTDGFREHSKQRRQAFRANLGVYDSGWENRTWLAYTNQHFEIPGPISRNMVFDDDQYDKTTDNLPLRPLQTNPRRHTEGLRLSNLTTLQLDRWTHSIGVYLQRTDDYFRTPAQVWEMDSNTLGLQYMVDAQFKQLSLGGGLSYAHTSGDFSVYGNVNQPLPPLRLMHPQDYDIKANYFSAQLRGAWEFVPHWKLSTQLQFVHTGRDVNGMRSGLNGMQSHNDSWSWVSPKIALSWEPNDATLVFANVSASREAPTLRDMVQFAGPAGAPVLGPNGRPMFRRGLTYVRELEPQRNLSYEIGTRGLFNQQYGWDITLYHADIDKELIAYSPDGANTFTYNYEGDTRHRGVELGLSAKWDLGTSGNLAGRVAYTYNNFEFRDGMYSGNDIGGLPRHYLSANLDYRYREFEVGVNVRGSLGSTYADHANTQKMGSYAILGAHFSYDFAKDSNFYVQVDNITDRRYISWTLTPAMASAQNANNQAMYFPGNGRTVTAGLNFRF